MTDRERKVVVTIEEFPDCFMGTIEGFEFKGSRPILAISGESIEEVLGGVATAIRLAKAFLNGDKLAKETSPDRKFIEWLWRITRAMADQSQEQSHSSGDRDKQFTEVGSYGAYATIWHKIDDHLNEPPATAGPDIKIPPNSLN